MPVNYLGVGKRIDPYKQQQLQARYLTMTDLLFLSELLIMYNIITG